MNCLCSPTMALGVVLLQVVALTCIALVGSKLQPLLHSITAGGGLEEPNCVMELSMFTDQDRAQDIVVGKNWFQVNRADKQCAGHCHRRLPSAFSDIANYLAISSAVNQIGRLPGTPQGQQLNRLCWFRKLYPDCHVCLDEKCSAHDECPLFEMDVSSLTAKVSEIFLVVNATQQGGVKKISVTSPKDENCITRFKCGYTEVRCLKRQQLKCRTTIPYVEPAYTCSMTAFLAESVLGAQSTYVTASIGVVVLILSFTLNTWMFLVISGATIRQVATWLYHRCKYGDIGRVEDQGDELQPSSAKFGISDVDDEVEDSLQT